jgi:hypothetical protein
MAVPLQVQPYTNLLGTHEGLGPLILPEVFSPDGSVNVWIDRLARVRRIDGYVAANAAEVDTDTGGSNTVVTFLAPRVTAAGVRSWVGLFNDLDNEAELWISDNDGDTWTFKLDLGAPTSGHVPVGAQFGDDFYITYGAETPSKYSGSAITAVSVTQSPTPTGTVAGDQGLLDGTYKYKLVSMLASGRKNGSAASTAETVSLDNIDVSWTADADTNVIGYELYRTTGVGQSYYFVGWIEGRTTVAYTDMLPDVMLLERRSLEEHGDAPPAVPFCVVHGDRMWWLGGTTTNRARGYWSDLGRPESVGAFSYLDFTDPAETHQVITGAAGNFNKKLVVFTRSNVWTVSGTGAVIGALTDWTKRRTNATAGTIHHNTIVRVPPGAVWRDEAGQAHKTEVPTLGYMTPNRDIRLFDGDGDVVISHPVGTTLASAVIDITHMAPHALHDEKRGHIAWIYGTTAVPTRAVVWNYRYGTWYQWDSTPFASSGYCETGTSPAITAPVMLTGSSNISGAPGKVYDFFSGNTFAGTTIDARWMTGTIYGRLGEDVGGRENAAPAFSYQKRLRWADLILMPVTGVTLTVEAFAAHVPASGTAFVTKTVQPNTAGTLTNIRRVIFHNSSGRFLHDVGFRLRIGNAASTDPWAIEGMMIGFQILPGLKRRSG